MTSDDIRKLHEFNKKSCDTLVRLGVVNRSVVNDATMSGGMGWTPEGAVFRKYLIHLYDNIANGRGEDGTREFLRLITFIVGSSKR
jgi:hypothetical protein